MKYDFTSKLNRTGMDSIAVDIPNLPGFAPLNITKEGFEQIPMWVADMNFATVPTIPETIIERVSHPAYGYFRNSAEYYNKILTWHKRRNNMELLPEYIGYENSVLGGLVSAMGVLCSAGDNVLLHSPTYIGFTNSLTNAGYKIVHSPLVKDENDIWRMDFEHMEKTIVEKKIHTTVFCSPHNPTGRVWEEWEIKKAMELFKKHDVYVVSDEIWSDLLLNGNKHIPTQSISDDAKMRTIALYAPSKTFNLAGLIGAYHVIYNKYLKDRVVKESSLCHYNAQNVLSMHALIGAYKDEGHIWVDELCEVLSDNVNYAVDFIKANFKGVKVQKPEGTYMLFIDCEEWCEAHNTDIESLQRMGWEVGVMWQDGRMFNGTHSIRLNLALPKTRVIEAFERMDKYIFNASK